MRMAAECNRDVQCSGRIDRCIDVQQVHAQAIGIVLRCNQTTFSHLPLMIMLGGLFETTQIVKTDLCC